MVMMVVVVVVMMMMMIRSNISQKWAESAFS